jgi:hypothetical protein
VDIALTGVDNVLEGTQTLPVSFLDNIKQAYTFPTPTPTNSRSHRERQSFFSDQLLLGGNAYYRKYKNQNVSSNVNDEFGEVDPNTGIANDVQATNDRSVIDQDSYGLGAQLTLTNDLMGKKNQFTVGASGDFGRAHFTQDSQEAQFTATRAPSATI